MRYTVDDIRKACRIIERQNTLLPRDVLDFIFSAAVEKANA